MSYDPTVFVSDYVCPECGGLLYTDPENGFDICVNPNCRRFPVGMQFYDPKKEAAPELHSELDTIHSELLSKVRNCDPIQLALYAYEKRKGLIILALRLGIMPSIPDFLALGELLMILNGNPPKGDQKDPVLFESIFQRTRKRMEYLNFIDDVEEQRYFWRKAPGQSRVLIMKYLSVIRNVYKSYGIASSSSIKDESDLFEFQDIQELVTDDVQLKPEVGYADFLDTLWPYVLTLRYGFSMHYRTSKQYDYNVDGFDIAALVSCFSSISNDTTSILPISKLRHRFGMQCQGNKSFDEFLGEYVSSASKVPIMVRVMDTIIMDRLSLLYFIIYLQGQYVVSRSGQKVRGKRIAKRKQQAGLAFENSIRTRVSEHGYTGPNEAVQERFDYDVIKLSEAKKRIILADVKYRDPSPSSISGQTLVQQELLDKREGLLLEAERQLERLKYFKQNPEKFRKYLDPQFAWSAYEVRAYLITKHVPLICQYKEVAVVAASDFFASEI